MRAWWVVAIASCWSPPASSPVSPPASSPVSPPPTAPVVANTKPRARPILDAPTAYLPCPSRHALAVSVTNKPGLRDDLCKPIEAALDAHAVPAKLLTGRYRVHVTLEAIDWRTPLRCRVTFDVTRDGVGVLSGPRSASAAGDAKVELAARECVHAVIDAFVAQQLPLVP